MLERRGDVHKRNVWGKGKKDERITAFKKGGPEMSLLASRIEQAKKGKHLA